jgi:hypothetical protein
MRTTSSFFWILKATPSPTNKNDISSTSPQPTRPSTYDERVLEDVDIRARGIVDKTGAEITELKIETPIGVSSMSGTLADWAAPKYSLNIESTVDLTQTSNIFPLGASLRGVGNFKGTVSGEGEHYKVTVRSTHRR